MTFQFRKEAIEEDLNSNFPSQGQGNPPLYYSLSDVVVPTYNINPVTEGSTLPANLQTAWDFSTGHATFTNTETTFINTPGFWQVDVNAAVLFSSGVQRSCRINLFDGVTRKIVWEINSFSTGADDVTSSVENKFVVFLRSGDSLVALSSNTSAIIDVWYRQIATVNGTLVNPLGYSAA